MKIFKRPLRPLRENYKIISHNGYSPSTMDQLQMDQEQVDSSSRGCEPTSQPTTTWSGFAQVSAGEAVSLTN